MRRPIVCSVLLLSVLLLSACGEKPPAAAAAGPTPQAVTVTAVTAGAVERWTEAVGTLVARDEAVIANAGLAAPVTAVRAEVGDRVVAGAVLAELDPRDLEVRAAQAVADRARAEALVLQAEAQVADARTVLVQAEADLARAEGLAPGGLVAAETLDARRAAVTGAAARRRAAEAAVAMARADIARCEAVATDLATARARLHLTAPVAGLVLTRTVRLGAQAGPGEPQFTLAVDGVVEARVEVPETLLAGVAVGQVAEVRAGTARWAGKVRLIEPRVDVAARSGAVRVTLEGDAPRHVGASVAVRLATGREEGLVAPLAAVRGQGAEAAVLVAEVSGPPGPRMPAVVKRVPVNLGLADGDRVVLRQGPPAGAWLIATAPDLVTVDGPCVAVPQDR